MEINNIGNNSSDIVLLKDGQWSAIDGELCRVIDFSPFLHIVKSGKVLALGEEKYTPYASITIECKKISGQKRTGFVTNKMDFINLWAAFKDRGVKRNEEVIICWSKKHYKLKWLKFLPGFWPKLWVMVCKKGAYELMTNKDYKPELSGEARFLAERPIIEWKPDIME